MSDLLFYGKLKNRRDFVYSSSLSYDEKIFWADWFDGCVISKSLPNFLRQKATSKIWLFICKTEDICRIDVITMSQDYSGRLYPFVVYQTIDIQQALKDYEAQTLLKTIKLENLLLVLNQSIENGNIIDDQQLFKKISTKSPVWQKSQDCFNVFFNTNAEVQSCFCWVSLFDNVMIDISTTPTRSLYTKLFG